MNRMSERDFQERYPERRNDSSPSSTGLAVWEEAHRARQSEDELLELLQAHLNWYDGNKLQHEPGLITRTRKVIESVTGERS